MLLDLDSLVKAEKVRAHPERHLVRVTNLEDRGIMAADNLAGSPEGADLVLSADQVLQTLTAFSKVCLTHLSSNSIAMGNLDEMRVAMEKAEYLSNRDKLRAEQDRAPKWANLNTRLGALTLGGGKRGLASQSCATRIQFDWYYWGSNRAKGAMALDSDKLCPLCQGLEDQHHVLKHCCDPLMTAVRGRVWGLLDAFLKDVAGGDTVSALEEAQLIARASLQVLRN